MYTVRQLITDAFRKSTVRGLNDTPEDEEIKSALSSLNTSLDMLTADAQFSVTRKAIKVPVGSDGYITISENPARIIVTARTTGPNEVTCKTEAEHGLSVSDYIDLGRAFYSGIAEIDRYFNNLEVMSIVDPFTFVIRTRSGLITGVKSGPFKKSSEGPEYEIAVIDCPPDNIYQVVDENGHLLPELQEQDFYANRQRRNWDWFFYEKSRDPYPKVWIGGKSMVTLVYTEPFWHDLKLDTDMSKMPRSAQSTLKYMLAMDIAEENGYLEIADRLRKRYLESYATYCRTVEHSASPLPDFSAPGYFAHWRYNIENDGGYGGGWFC